jgi:hypothetical protein
MTARQDCTARGLRITAREVNARLQSGESVTTPDARNDPAWEAIRSRSSKPYASGRAIGSLTRVLAERSANGGFLNLTQRAKQRLCGAMPT